MDEKLDPFVEELIPPKTKPKRPRWLIPTIAAASLMVIFLMMLAITMVVLLQNAGGHGMMDKAKALARKSSDLVECQKNLQSVGAALKRYDVSQGHYPPSLEALYPEYLPSRLVLRCPADRTGAKNGPSSYLYKPPLENASDDTIVCVCRHHQILRDQPMELRLSKDGDVTAVAPVEAGK